MQKVQFLVHKKIVGMEFVLEQLQEVIVAIIVQKWEVVIVVLIQKRNFLTMDIDIILPVLLFQNQQEDNVETKLKMVCIVPSIHTKQFLIIFFDFISDK